LGVHIYEKWFKTRGGYIKEIRFSKLKLGWDFSQVFDKLPETFKNLDFCSLISDKYSGLLIMEELLLFFKFAQFYQKVNTTMIVISACLKSESSQFYRKIEPNEGHKSDQSTETEVLVSCTILGYPLSCSKSALVGQAVSESSDLHTLFAVSTAHMSIRWDFILLLFLKNISSILDPNNV
jgi:hypothetical protein